MKSRALRLTLLVLFVGVIAGAAYLVWKEERQVAAAAAAFQAFDDRARAVSRLVLDIKGAQAGYVAAGQGDDFWIARVDAFLESVRDQMPALRSQARSSLARNEIASAAAAVDDFEQMDRRARDYVRGGQRLLASDLVFSDGIERIDAALTGIDRARHGETAERDLATRQGRRMQMLAIAGAAALGLLIALALAPLPPPLAPAGMTEKTEQKAERDQPAASVTLRHSLAAPPPEPTEAAQAAAEPSPPPSSTPRPATPEAPTVDLPGIAALCTDLSRVLDTRALPGALERAAGLLDASGVVVWIADPDGRELAPVIAHGYPEHRLARMGTIGRDAENVTAAAFRTGLVQTVKSDEMSHGAIAAPLLTPAGPVGVMAAELLHNGERRDATRAVATIVAAQLATLMGPPSSRTEKTEAAGA
ncbi:MAG: GAF domain-containing protein [Vicinamibacterales bacterium]